jgi:ABC-type Na+ efflux pump permease subunit
MEGGCEMKNNFRGWKTVFDFTFRQSTKGAAFKIVTVLMALVIIAGFVLINVFVAKPDENVVEISPVKTVFILDDSGLQPTDYRLYNPELSSEKFKDITFMVVTDKTRKEVIDMAAADSTESIAVIITAAEEGFAIEAAIPKGSTISKGQAGDVLTQLQSSFESSKLMQSGLSQEQLYAVLMPVVTNYSNIGENTNEIAFVIKLIAPMLFGFVLYFMLLLYGQTISKSVSTEKTSRLMETILTSIHPYALITGKVLAITSMAVLQFVIWIASGAVGLYGGNAVAKYFYPEYQNSVITIINFLKENIGQTAMTAPAVIAAIIIFCFGFLFYSVLAGLAGSMVSKPEDVASTQALFTLPIVISFLVSYLAPIMGNETVTAVLRYIPFTIPFTVPSELITGTIGLGQGAISLVILGIFCILFIMLSGKLYKGLILYTGQKADLKMMMNVLRAKE